jgi:hypothetical protein
LPDPTPNGPQTTHVWDDRGHGRTERRTIRTAPADDSLLPGARQVFRLRRDTGDLDGVWTAKEIVFGVVSMSPVLAGPEHINYYERAHWGSGEPAALGPRRHLPRRQLPAQDRNRTPSPGHLSQPSHQRVPSRRPRQHRLRPRDLLNHDDAFAVYGI